MHLSLMLSASLMNESYGTGFYKVSYQLPSNHHPDYQRQAENYVVQHSQPLDTYTYMR